MMDRFTRRRIIQAGVAAAGTAAAPYLALAQGGGGKVIKVAGDVPVYDPVVGTSNGTYNHARLVYDTLFGGDENGIPKPQMVGKYGLSDDKLTWTFELRDGLKFHDRSPVTTADVIPSIRRWAARSGIGTSFMAVVKDLSAKDANTFTITLKEPYGLVLDSLSNSLFIMRKKEAETDPSVKIDTVIGSGPFKLNLAETKAGTQYVYDRNPDYLPRKEPPSGLSGGKVVKVDRIIYIAMPDVQSAIAAVQTGEIDYLGDPPIDMLDTFAKDKNLKLQVLDRGQLGLIRFNFLHPPFNNVKCRQAMLHLVNQTDYLKGSFANPAYFKTCGSYLGCGMPMENDANMEWFKGAPNMAKAKQLLKEGGYDGRPVLILQPTNWLVGKNAAEILASQMRAAGINAQLVTSDWTGVVARRASKAPPNQGGWNIFISSTSVADAAVPLSLIHKTNGDKAWFGWPNDPKQEELREKWARAVTMEERKKVAREIQQNAWDFVPLMSFGQWVQPALMNAKMSGLLKTPFAAQLWWNVEKA